MYIKVVSYLTLNAIKLTMVIYNNFHEFFKNMYSY